MCWPLLLLFAARSVAASLDSAFICAPFNPPATCDALGALFYATGGASWSNSDGWASAAAGNQTDVCTFHGVSCNTGIASEQWDNYRSSSGSTSIETATEDLGSVTAVVELCARPTVYSGSAPF